MIDYEPPFTEEFSADGDYWSDVPLPWEEGNDEEMNDLLRHYEIPE
jgi:hypothetical protein